MTSVHLTRSLERLLKSLANEKRLRIIQFLSSRGEESVSEIASAIRLSHFGTSKHLQKLFREGVVEKRKSGIEVFYRLARKKDLLLRAVLKKFL